MAVIVCASVGTGSAGRTLYSFAPALVAAWPDVVLRIDCAASSLLSLSRGVVSGVDEAGHPRRGMRVATASDLAQLGGWSGLADKLPRAQVVGQRADAIVDVGDIDAPHVPVPVLAAADLLVLTADSDIDVTHDVTWVRHAVSADVAAVALVQVDRSNATQRRVRGVSGLEIIASLPIPPHEWPWILRRAARTEWERAVAQTAHRLHQTAHRPAGTTGTPTRQRDVPAPLSDARAQQPHTAVPAPTDTAAPPESSAQHGWVPRHGVGRTNDASPTSDSGTLPSSAATDAPAWPAENGAQNATHEATPAVGGVTAAEGPEAGAIESGDLVKEYLGGTGFTASVAESEVPAPSPPPIPYVRLLGPFQVDDAAGETQLDRSQTRRLVAYLSLRPDASLEQVTDALWPEEAPGNEVVDTALSRVRRWLGRSLDGQPYGPPTGANLRLHSAVRSDWDDFQELTDARVSDPVERLRRLDLALALIRGQPLDGIPDAWAEEDRAQVTRHVTATAAEAAERHLDDQDSPAARRAVTAGRLVDAVDENLRRVLLRVEHACKRRTYLIRTYETYEQQCRSLGTTPDPGIIALYEQLMNEPDEQPSGPQDTASRPS